MKRRNVLKRIAVFAAVLAIPALVVGASAFAGGSTQQPFSASYVNTYVEHDGYYYLWDGEGNGTLLGNSASLVAVHVSGNKAEGVQTLTAANGDSLVIAFAQTFDKSAQKWAGTFTVTGGTGRFAQASGGGTIVASGNPDGTRTATLNGTIRL